MNRVKEAMLNNARLVSAITLASVLVLASPRSAHAAEPTDADRATARNLLDQGDQAWKAQDYATALKAYRGADAIMHVPSTGVEVARAEEMLGHPLEANEACHTVTRHQATEGEPAAFTRARERCVEITARTQPRIATVKLELVGLPADASPKITIDGATVPAAASALPRKANPGRHVVRVHVDGFVDGENSFLLGDGESKAVQVEMRAGSNPSASATNAAPHGAAATAGERGATAPSHERAPIPTYAWVGLGVGAAGLVVGSITGLTSLSKASDAKAMCTGNLCPDSASDTISSSKTMANVSNVSFALAIVGAGVGIYGIVARPRAEATAAVRVTPYFGAGSAGLTGAF